MIPERCGILLCQNEIPLKTTLALIKAAAAKGIYTIFNVAPAPAATDVPEILKCINSVSLICPNEVEASMLTGMPVTDMESGIRCVESMRTKGWRNIVITLGSKGCLVLEEGARKVVPHSTGKGETCGRHNRRRRLLRWCNVALLVAGQHARRRLQEGQLLCSVERTEERDPVVIPLQERPAKEVLRVTIGDTVTTNAK